MKKMIVLLFALMLCLPVLAESTEAIPVEIVEVRAQDHIQVGLEEALTTAMSMLPAQVEQYQSRAEAVRMSDGSYRWVVTVFDLTTLTDGWCVEIDAATGEVLSRMEAADGFFWESYTVWTEQKGPHALWKMEDKQLYDALYATTPAYGLPMQGDLSAEKALNKALAALGMDAVGGYQVGYGYFKGGEDCNGVWEICLVVDGEVDCRVTLDAVTGEVYYLERYLVEADEANG